MLLLALRTDMILRVIGAGTVKHREAPAGLQSVQPMLMIRVSLASSGLLEPLGRTLVLRRTAHLTEVYGALLLVCLPVMTFPISAHLGLLSGNLVVQMLRLGAVVLAH